MKPTPASLIKLNQMFKDDKNKGKIQEVSTSKPTLEEKTASIPNPKRKLDKLENTTPHVNKKIKQIPKEPPKQGIKPTKPLANDPLSLLLTGIKK